MQGGTKDATDLPSFQRTRAGADRLSATQARQRLVSVTQPKNRQQANDDYLAQDRKTIDEKRQPAANQRSFGQIKPIHNYFESRRLSLDVAPS